MAATALETAAAVRAGDRSARQVRLTEAIEREECWTVSDLEREMKTLLGE